MLNQFCSIAIFVFIRKKKWKVQKKVPLYKIVVEILRVCEYTDSFKCMHLELHLIIVKKSA